MMLQRRSHALAGFLAALAGLALPLSAAPLDDTRLVATTHFGGSRQGRPLIVHRLAHPSVDAQGRGPDERPALLILAGVDARHRVGSAVAEGVVSRLASALGDGQLLRERTVYVVPLLNPDNAAWHADRAVPLSEFGRTVAPYDADRDRRINEDPANDLDGDGLITTMRVYRPRPETGLRADWIIDPDEPRLMKKPDAAKGEVATHAVLIEGIDVDGDGKFNEDGPGGEAGGGVDLNMNFPAFWPEFTDGAGEFALSEPESHALAEWVLARPNIHAVIIYGLHDNLVNAPASGRMDVTGRVPLGVEDGDKPYHDEISRLFKEMTGMTGAPKVETAGSPGAWMYAHMGLHTFMTPVWVRPDLVKREGKAAEAPAEQGGAAPAEQGATAPDLNDPNVLAARGVPPPVVAFMTGDGAARAQLMKEYEEAPPEVRAQIDASIAALPQDVQAQLAVMMADPAASPAPAPAPAVAPAPAATRRGQGGQGGARGGAPAGGGGGAKKGESDDHKWLAYLDEHLDGRGFVAWKEIDHPQLGRVEVGGFGPHVRLNPPTDALDQLADEQAKFAMAVLDRLPDVEVSVRHVERVGPGVWRIGVVGRNPGYFPTVSAMGQKARRLAPVVLVLEAPMERIVSGARQQRWNTIAGSGGEAHAEWLVHAPDGSKLDLTVRSPGFGNRTISITLEEVRR
jgi:hypothetical protein